MLGFTLVYPYVLFLKLRTLAQSYQQWQEKLSYTTLQLSWEKKRKKGRAKDRIHTNTLVTDIRPSVAVDFLLPYASTSITTRTEGDFEQQLTRLGSASHGWQNLTQITWLEALLISSETWHTDTQSLVSHRATFHGWKSNLNTCTSLCPAFHSFQHSLNRTHHLFIATLFMHIIKEMVQSSFKSHLISRICHCVPENKMKLFIGRNLNI